MNRRIGGSVAEAIVVVTLVVTYFAYVFRLPSSIPFTVGMGDWVDPYFINYLLEHWDHSLRHATNPFSPPMFFPAGKTLGYSHGLILYVPFYSMARLFLDPLRAYNLALFLVLVFGSLCLYVIFRRGLRVGFIASLVLTAFFFTSRNVTNEMTSVWSQRASVFLIPPIWLMAIATTRTRDGGLKRVLGFFWGLLAVLLFTQDFYTAQLALLMAALLAVGLLFVSKPADLLQGARRIWNDDGRYVLSVAGGAAIGALVFAWIYLGAFLDHPAFPEDELLKQLIVARVTRATVDWTAFAHGYLSLRSFGFVLLLGAAVMLPMSRMRRQVRVYALWVMAISAVVLVIPIRFNNFSIWKTLFFPVPGLSAIRDPKRIVALYELAVVLVTGYAMTLVPPRSFFRVASVLVAVTLLITGWNPERFMFKRSVQVFDTWIRTPMAVDPSCQSFFIRKASDAYASRSFHMWMLYAGDAMFISLAHSIPTLNGYSAWTPNGWRLVNPHDPDYHQAAAEWIALNELHNVCELDIEKRKMSPWPEKPDFSGEWTLNREASMLSPVVAPDVRSGTLRIEHREPNVTLHLAIMLDGKPFESTFEMVSDGRDVVETSSGRRTVGNLRWDGEALVATWRVAGTKDEVTIVFRYELQDGGRRVRAVEQIRGGGRDQDNVWVFERP